MSSESLQGSFLIAGRELRDPNFYKTVILMVEHNKSGAMGLVVNRPSTVSVSHALSSHFEIPETEDLVYVGGPVEPTGLFVLHDSDELDGEREAVVPGLYVGGSPEVFERIVESAVEDLCLMQYRIYSGCAGWGPGQLENEISRGDWQVIGASGDLVLSEDPYSIWERAMARFSFEHQLFPGLIQNPEWN